MKRASIRSSPPPGGCLTPCKTMRPSVRRAIDTAWLSSFWVQTRATPSSPKLVSRPSPSGKDADHAHAQLRSAKQQSTLVVDQQGAASGTTGEAELEAKPAGVTKARIDVTAGVIGIRGRRYFGTWADTTEVEPPVDGAVGNCYSKNAEARDGRGDCVGDSDRPCCPVTGTISAASCELVKYGERTLVDAVGNLGLVVAKRQRHRLGKDRTIRPEVERGGRHHARYADVRERADTDVRLRRDSAWRRTRASLDRCESRPRPVRTDRPRVVDDRPVSALCPPTCRPRYRRPHPHHRQSRSRLLRHRNRRHRRSSCRQPIPTPTRRPAPDVEAYCACSSPSSNRLRRYTARSPKWKPRRVEAAMVLGPAYCAVLGVVSTSPRPPGEPAM